MRYQLGSTGCAAAAIQNALRFYAADALPGQHRLKELLREEGDGADEADVSAALSMLGYYGVPAWENDDDEAWRFAQACVHFPILLCVDDWGHWVTLIGVCGDRVLLCDPVDEIWNRQENGLWAMQRNSLLRRWHAARRIRRPGGRYYGLAILEA